MGNRKNTFLLKRSNVAGNIPSAGQILLGELALNTADVVLYASGTTTNSILPIGWDRVHRTGDTMTGPLIINSELTANTISATTISATTFYGDGSNLTGIAVDNFYTTATSISNDVIYFDRTDSLSAYTQNINHYNNNSIGLIYNNSNWVDNNDGTITLPELEVLLTDNKFYTGVTNNYIVTGGTSGVEFDALVNNNTNYIYVDYNSGNPQLTITTIEPDYNRSDRAKYLTIYRVDNFLHILNWGSEGSGLSNKIVNRLYGTNFIERESGLSLGLSGSTNIVTLTSGIVWNGVKRTIVGPLDSVDSTYFVNYHSGGEWTFTTTATTVNNQFYDNGTNLQALGNNKFVVNWYYAGVEIDDHLYEIIGSNEYNNVSQAQLETAPIPPNLITSHAILVGRIIILKNAVGGIIESAFDVTFSPSQVVNHNDLADLQGGVGGQYYHITSDEAEAVSGSDSPSSSNVFITDSAQKFVTGGTFSSETLTLNRNDGNDVVVTGFTSGGGSEFTGGTVSGPTNFTDGLSANTISATTYNNLPQDVFVTGGTLSTGGTITLTKSDGNSVDITNINSGNAVVDNFYYQISNNVDTRPIFEDDNVVFGWDEPGNDLEFRMKVAPSGTGDMRASAYLLGGGIQSTAIVATGVNYDVYAPGVSAGNRLDVFISAENDVSYPAYRVIVFNTGESYLNTIWIERITKK